MTLASLVSIQLRIRALNTAMTEAFLISLAAHSRHSANSKMKGQKKNRRNRVVLNKVKEKLATDYEREK